MAKFKFDPINERLIWLNSFAAFDDGDFGASSNDDYDGYLEEDGDSDAEEYGDEEEYDGDEYEDGEEYEDDGEYEDDPEYDDGEEYEDDDEYDDEEYEDDGEYEDDELYGEDDGEEYDDGDFGYNPEVFNSLDGEDEEYDEGEEEEYYDDNPMDGDGDYPEEESGEEFEAENGTDWLGRIKGWLDNDYVLYALCALIPLLALYLIWRRRGFDSQKKWILTGVAIVCLIIWMILCWPFGGTNDNTSNAGTDSFDFSNQSYVAPSDTDFQFGANTDETPAPNSDEPSPSPTVHATDNSAAQTGTNTLNQSDIVWSTNANIYYHTKSDCGGMTGATSMTLEAAIQRGKTACPECAGGTSNFADNVTPTTYYATAKGTWYHTNPTCQGMTGASQVTESAAIQAGKSACPVCIGYYGTNGGQWYHSISNCQGMQNAVTKTEAEWKALGKTACPTCLGGSNTVKTKSQPTETQVYATTTGTYFHTTSDCSGMKGASQVALSRAVSSGKKACPRCVSPSKVYVFATQGGTYYHTKANCSGMTGATYITQKQAINAGKSACSKCNARSLGSSSASTGTGTTAVTLANNTAANKTAAATTLKGNSTADTATYVYATKNGTYYHTKSNCSGMAGATRLTYAQAISAGKKACPTCVTASAVKVFATQGGKYYHTKANCSGMTGAVQVTVSKALSAGKTACPTCAKALGNATATKASSAAATQNTGTAANTKTTANTVTNPTKASAETNVYITVGAGSGSYYHKAAKCATHNFSNGMNVTLEYALGHGYKACPDCQPPKSIS